MATTSPAKEYLNALGKRREWLIRSLEDISKEPSSPLVAMASGFFPHDSEGDVVVQTAGNFIYRRLLASACQRAGCPAPDRILPDVEHTPAIEIAAQEVAISMDESLGLHRLTALDRVPPIAVRSEAVLAILGYLVHRGQRDSGLAALAEGLAGFIESVGTDRVTEIKSAFGDDDRPCSAFADMQSRVEILSSMGSFSGTAEIGDAKVATALSEGSLWQLLETVRRAEPQLVRRTVAVSGDSLSRVRRLTVVEAVGALWRLGEQAAATAVAAGVSDTRSLCWPFCSSVDREAALLPLRGELHRDEWIALEQRLTVHTTAAGRVLEIYNPMVYELPSELYGCGRGLSVQDLRISRQRYLEIAGLDRINHEAATQSSRPWLGATASSNTRSAGADLKMVTINKRRHNSLSDAVRRDVMDTLLV